MSAGRVGLLDRKVSILVQIVFAALCFMAITQLSHVAVIRGLMLAGLRADVPMVVAIEGCGKTVEMAPIDRIAASGISGGEESFCPDAKDLSPVDVTVTAPSGRIADLIVNYQKVQSAMGSGGKITFSNVILRRGRNILAVAVGDKAEQYLSLQEASQWSVMTFFGMVPEVFGGMSVGITIGQHSFDHRVIGAWKTDDGYNLLVSGDGNTGLPLEEFGQHGFLSIGRSGFGIASVSEQPPGVPLLTDQMFQRHFIVARDPADDITIDMTARLPLSSNQAQWLLKHRMSALEFAKFNGLDLRPSGVVGNLKETVSAMADGDAVKVSGRISASGVVVAFAPDVEVPSDSAIFRGFGSRLQYARPGDLDETEDVATVSGSDPGNANVQPNYSEEFGHGNEDGGSASTHDDGNASSGIARAWERVEYTMPFWLRALLSGLAGLAPIILLIVSIRKAEQIGGTSFRSTEQALPSLLCLLLLGAAIVAQPLFFQIYNSGARALDIWPFTSDFRGDGTSTSSDPYASIALAISLMLVPFLHSLKRPAGTRTVICSIASPVFCLLGVATLVSLLLLQLRPWSGMGSDGIYGWLESKGFPNLPVSALTLAALAAGLLFAWIPLYWSFRILSPAGGFLRASIVAGIFTILLPLVMAATDAVQIFFSTPNGFIDFSPSFQSVLASAVLPFFLFFVLLKAFRDIGGLVLPHRWQDRVNAYATNRWLLLIAALLTLPLIDFSKAPASGEANVLQVLGTFQSFSLVIASAAVVCGLTQRRSVRTPSGDIAKFVFGPREILLLTALYAGYLSLWTHQTLPTLAAIFFGWLIFRHIIIDNGSLMPLELATPQTAADLINIQQESALLKARRKTIEEKFTKGETSYPALTAARKRLDAIREQQERVLRISLGEAKRRLLEFGPGSSPLRNGVRGAIAGIAFGTVLQLSTSIHVPELAGPLKEWVAFAHTALVDPGYSITQDAASMRIYSSSDIPEAVSPDLLLFIRAVINAYFLWSLLGFLFGFVFHRIRGDDGVVKALVFSAGVTATYAISQLFSTSSDGINLIRMLPVMVFLLVTGIAVFDVRSLATRGISPARLADVYGFRTSVGYASVLGAIVALQPIISFIREAMGGGK